ncbi:hypothetical protein [Mycobacterium sp. URHB0021]
MAPWYSFVARFFTGAGIGGEYAAINSAAGGVRDRRGVRAGGPGGPPERPVSRSRASAIFRLASLLGESYGIASGKAKARVLEEIALPLTADDDAAPDESDKRRQ